MMRFWRSFAFNTLFNLNLAVRLIGLLPVFFFASEARGWGFVNAWGRSSLRLMDRIVGTRSVVTGQENLPEGGCIVAAKHQAYWDVVALVPEIHRPTFILKKELMAIPIFGWYARHMGMIPIDRTKRGGAVQAMLDSARAAVADGRKIVIFPEGTRTIPGAEAEYRQGVFRLYEALGLPVVPVALNSGVYWPKRSRLRYPGTARAEFLPPIPPGLDRTAFLERLRGAIETRSDELLALSATEDGLHVPVRPKGPLAPVIEAGKVD